MAKSGKTILIVDDEFALALALELILTNERYRVAVAYNGGEAIAGLSKIKPDLVILDVMMPIRDGLEVLAIIRKQTIFRRLPVILTGEVAPKMTQAQGGWNLWLAKPFQLTQITEAVMQLIGPAR